MEDNGSLTWTLAVDAATVERAKATGQPQITVPREITALATQVPGGLPRKDYAPPSVYVSGGEVQLEHNDRLDQSQWFGYDGYLGYRDKMVREWPILQAGKLAWSLSTLSRQWRIDPPKGGDSRDLMIAEFTRTVIEDHYAGGGGGMMGLLSQFATLPTDGFVLGQPYYPVDPTITVRDDSGAVVLEGAHTLQIAPIPAWNVQYWLPEPGPHNRTVWGVEVYNVGGDEEIAKATRARNYDNVRFRADQLVHARFMPQGNDPAPYGLLRPNWSLWEQWRTLSKLQINGWQKAAFGIPQIETTAEANPGDIATVNQIVSNLRAGALARYSLPPGFRVTYREVPFRAGDLDKTKQQLKMDALAGMFAQHVATGSANGTQALHGSQKQEFHSLAEYVARTIVSTLTRGPVSTAPLKRLVSLNFRDVESYPVLSFGPMPVADPSAFVDAITKASDAGALTLDGGIEATIRDALNLPEMPMETSAQWKARLQNEAPPNITPTQADTGEEDEPDSPDEPPGGPPDGDGGGVTDSGGEEADDAEDQSEVRAAAEDPAKTPALPEERVRGSKKNPKGSASGKRGGIEVSATVEKALRGKVEDHNERRTSKARRVDLGMLKAVYRRGAGAFAVSHRPGMTRNQWAMGRVNGFLRRVAGKGGHPQDDDLLPEGHPNKPRAAADLLPESRVMDDRIVAGPGGRAVRPIETVVRLSETLAVTNEGKQEITKVLVDWRMETAKEYGERLEEEAENLGDVADIPIPNERELERNLITALRRVYRAGRRSVESEMDRLEDDPSLAADLATGEAKVGSPGIPAPERTLVASAESDTHIPPESVRKAARDALSARKDAPPSERGMTAVGLARARDLANGRPVTIATMRRMRSYFARHEVDKEGATWDEKGKGWQAWHGWGGDPGREWVERTLEREDARAMSEHAACPAATQSVQINTRNRDATVRQFGYGPLNVDRPGDFWEEIAEAWDTSEEAARASLCANCVAFDISPRMEACMPGPVSDEDGRLGYCWMHHFKCHSARTCRTWAKGGPITEDEVSLEWQERSSGAVASSEHVHGPGCGCGSSGPGLHTLNLLERIRAMSDQPRVGGKRKVRAPKPAPDQPESEVDEIDPNEAIESVARTTVAAMIARLRNRAQSVLQNAGIGGALPAVGIGALVMNAIRALSPGTEANQAQADVNTTFGLGRAQQQRAEGAERFIYSNLLESQTCQFCAQFDGTVFGSDELDFFATPFQLCEGGDKCNCLILAVPPEQEDFRPDLG